MKSSIEYAVRGTYFITWLHSRFQVKAWHFLQVSCVSGTEVSAGDLALLSPWCTFSFLSLIVIKIEAKCKFLKLYIRFYILFLEK